MPVTASWPHPPGPFLLLTLLLGLTGKHCLGLEPFLSAAVAMPCPWTFGDSRQPQVLPRKAKDGASEQEIRELSTFSVDQQLATRGSWLPESQDD